ncbi:MAG TPA: hypothetical protein VJU61_25975, partial [Polyangiaceae bacterium]|nr:hypothetical protein [Polyangiaceae bacterium]
MNQALLSNIALSASLLAAVALAAGCDRSDPASPPATTSAAAAEHPLAESNHPDAVVARGHHLVSTSGCHDCHTPWKLGANGPEPDLSLALSGHPESMTLPPPPAPQGPWVVATAATNTAF